MNIVQMRITPELRALVEWLITSHPEKYPTVSQVFRSGVVLLYKREVLEHGKLGSRRKEISDP